MEENGRTVTVRSVSQQELFSNIPLQQGRIPQNESQFIATYETGDRRQSGIIPDLFDDDPRQFRLLEDYWDQFPEYAGIYAARQMIRIRCSKRSLQLWIRPSVSSDR